MILIFDDEDSIRTNLIKGIKAAGVDLEIIESNSKEDLRNKLGDENLMKKAKAFIFDLSTSREEAESKKFEILEVIKKNYEMYSLPIFIHSAFARLVEGYDNIGTVFKIQKDASSITEISEKIKLFYDTGFLEIFCPNGYLEKEVYKEIHKAFNFQFKGEEIARILASIKAASTESTKQRVISVFSRIAIRSLYQNLISAKRQENSENIEEVKINAVEHYYRRTSDFPVWTGDIFVNNKGNQIIILTPRCDINNGVCRDEFLVCEIESLDENIKKKISSDINKYLTDNPQQSGIKYRFLVPAPNYKGGKVDLSRYYIMPISQLKGQQAIFEYLISLSDELTNEVVRKYATYLLRGGISASEISEASFYSTLN